MLRTRHLVQSSLFVILIFALNKLTGFGKLVLMTSVFGTGPEADAYAAAMQLPELFLAMLAGGAVAAALIPVYSAVLTRADPAAARQMASTVVTLTLGVVGAVCLVAAWFAPWLVRVLLVPEFSPAQQILTADLMRIVLFSSVLIAVGSIFTSLLHAHQHFLAPAWGTVAIDLGQIVGLLWFVPVWGVYGAAWGSVLGAALLVIVHLPALSRYHIRPWPQLVVHLHGLGALFRLIWPCVVTLGAFQAVDLIFIRLASHLPDGSISAYFYAMLAMVAMPKSLFGTAIAHVIFPTLVEEYNGGNLRQIRSTLSGGIQAVWVLIIPSAVGLLALGLPAVTFLFQRGAFSESSTQLVYWLMVILAVRLVSDASQDILSLIFYAHHNTHTPMWATLGWMGLHVGLSLWFVGPWGIRGLALAASLSSLALTFALFLLSRRMIGPLDEDALGSTLLRLSIASLGMVVTIFLIRQLALDTLLFLIVATASGGVIFVLLYGWLGGRELRNVWRYLRRV